jgi:transcriptional regulator with XRE-family HTH domain
MNKNKVNNSEFAKRLKDIRQSHKMLLKDVALEIDMTVQTLIKYESGVLEPSLSTLIKFCNLYKVSPNYLLTGNDENAGQIKELEKRKLYNLLSLVLDGDIFYDCVKDELKFNNQKMKSKFVYCYATYMHPRDYSKLEIIDQILKYVDED